MERRKAKIENDHSSYAKGKKFLLCTTKKLNCVARCVMREVSMFPTYKAKENSTSSERQLMAEDLLCRLQAGEDIQLQRQIIVCLPATSDHTCHAVGPGEVVPEPIDRRIYDKIKCLVADNITDPSVIKRLLHGHIKAICSTIPHPTNKAFYPCDKTIRNHIYRAKNEKLCDEEHKIAAWVKI